MTCDSCADAAEWMPDETACNLAHCDEHLAACRYCQDDIKDQGEL